jgi:hypothetical protein
MLWQQEQFAAEVKKIFFLAAKKKPNKNNFNRMKFS